MVSHPGGLAGGFVVPVVIRLTARKDDACTRHHSSEARNFPITFTAVWFVLFAIVLFAIVFVGALVDSHTTWAFVPFFAMFVRLGLNLALSVVGMVQAPADAGGATLKARLNASCES